MKRCTLTDEFEREKDTEKIALPPIEHVEPEGNIVQIYLALNPVHLCKNSEDIFVVCN